MSTFPAAEASAPPSPVLYKDAPFVILDEPTAALDPIAEAEIYKQFSQMTAGKTAVSISHRMSGCRFCDRIIVLDHGRIAETEPTTPSSQTTASTPIFTKPRPNTTPGSSPSRPLQRKWGQENTTPGSSC